MREHPSLHLAHFADRGLRPGQAGHQERMSQLQACPRAPNLLVGTPTSTPWTTLAVFLGLWPFLFPTALKVKSELPGWLHRQGVASPATRQTAPQARPGHLDHGHRKGAKSTGLGNRPGSKPQLHLSAQGDRKKKKTQPEPQILTVSLGHFFH